MFRAATPRFAVHGDVGAFVKFGLDTQEPALRVGVGACGCARAVLTRALLFAQAGVLPTEAGFGADKEEQYGVLTTGASGDGEKGVVETDSGRYADLFEELAGWVGPGSPCARRASLAPIVSAPSAGSAPRQCRWTTRSW